MRPMASSSSMTRILTSLAQDNPDTSRGCSSTGSWCPFRSTGSSNPDDSENECSVSNEVGLCGKFTALLSCTNRTSLCLIAGADDPEHSERPGAIPPGETAWSAVRPAAKQTTTQTQGQGCH